MKTGFHVFQTTSKQQKTRASPRGDTPYLWFGTGGIGNRPSEKPVFRRPLRISGVSGQPLPQGGGDFVQGRVGNCFRDAFVAAQFGGLPGRFDEAAAAGFFFDGNDQLRNIVTDAAGGGVLRRAVVLVKGGGVAQPVHLLRGGQRAGGMGDDPCGQTRAVVVVML